MSADENITIDGNNYTLSTNNLLSRINRNAKQFKRTDNHDCFIEFTFAVYTRSVWIDFWNCTSEKGTGRLLMKDFLTYLLTNPQQITINEDTIIQAYAVASTIQNSRITHINDSKLINYYNQIGFNDVETGGITKVSGTIRNIIDKITSYRSAPSGGKFRKTKRRKTKRRRYTKRRK